MRGPDRHHERVLALADVVHRVARSKRPTLKAQNQESASRDLRRRPASRYVARRFSPQHSVSREFPGSHRRKRCGHTSGVVSIAQLQGTKPRPGIDATGRAARAGPPQWSCQ
jgi:hypothetical protein